MLWVSLFLVALKLTGLAEMSWLVATSPIWGFLGLFPSIFVLLSLTILIALPFGKAKELEEYYCKVIDKFNGN